MLNIDNKFAHGDIVYLKTDKEQLPRIVTCIRVTKNDLLYDVYQGANFSSHYDYELSETINELIVLQ